MDLEKIPRTIAADLPLALGCVAGMVAQRLAQSAISEVALLRDNREILCGAVMVAGALMHGMDLPRGLANGFIVIGLVNLVAALSLRFGIDII